MEGKLTSKIVLLFRVIELLQAGIYKTGQICKITGMNQRTLYRYLEKIEELGFVFDKDFEGRFFLDTEVVPDFVKYFVKKAA